jgi:cation/acetate symporter
VQFIKGSLLVTFCAILAMLILGRGLHVDTTFSHGLPLSEPLTEAWPGKPYVRDAQGVLWRKDADNTLSQVQWMVADASGTVQTINGVAKSAGGKLIPVGGLSKLPGGATSTGPLSPSGYLTVLEDSEVLLWSKEVIKDADGTTTTVWGQKPTPGAKLMQPGQHPLFKGIQGELPVADPAKPESLAARKKAVLSRIDFLSLMLALFCGTASLPHILIRYYTVKDQRSARKSTVVGIGVIGFFYTLTLFLGLGAMTSGALDLTDTNTAAPLMARTFGELPFAIISAIAFTTVLGTVSGLIMASAGAIVHDLLKNVCKMNLSDAHQVRAGKFAALVVGGIAMWLGIQFQAMNVSALVGWAFNIAASANLPALIMILFWRGTSKQGVASAIIVGLLSSLGWVLVSKEAFQNVYGFTADAAAAATLVPFSQPAIVTVPLGFATLILVSLLIPPKARVPKVSL